MCVYKFSVLSKLWLLKSEFLISLHVKLLKSNKKTIIDQNKEVDILQDGEV